MGSVTRSAAIRGVVVLLALVVVAGIGGGCAAIGVFAYKVLGPPPVPPRYVMPKEPTLVMVENAHSSSMVIPEADALARVVYDDLTEHQVAPLVDPTMVHDLRDANPIAFSKMTIAEVARKLGAKRVLYVHINRLDIDIPQGTEVVRASVSADVKVVNATTAQTAWPESGEAETYSYETPMQRIPHGASRAGLQQQILRQAGTEIARWFYEYKPETMSEEHADMKLR
jgi:hypothetical protein